MASPDDVYVQRTAAYSDRLAKEFMQMMADGEHTDFRLFSNDKSFNCHKAILSANSPVLKAMMKPHTAEASSGEVKLDNIPPDILQLLLTYMYTEEINVPMDLLSSLVEACDYLQLSELKEYCLERALEQLQPSHALSWNKVADTLSLDDMKTQCSRILQYSFKAVAKSMEFFELTLEQLNCCIADVQKKDVDSDDLLDAALGWISHQPSQRVNNMEDLLQKIPLANCSLQCLQDQMQKHQQIASH